MNLQAWLRPYFDADGPARVEAAVRAAEKRTRGEIVPVLARRSAPWGHAPWLLAVLVYAALAAGDLGLWQPWLPWGRHAWTPLLDVALAAFLGWSLGRWAPVLRALTPRHDRAVAVHLSAEAAFYRLGLRKTRESTGILLYVSLAEHRAVVLADSGIAAKVPEGTWDEVCDLLLKGAAAHDLASGYEAAIRRCADILAKPFPPRRRNPNELGDGLRILE